VIFLVTLLRSYFPPERVRRMLAGRGELTGTVSAALLSIVTRGLLAASCVKRHDTRRD